MEFYNNLDNNKKVLATKIIIFFKIDRRNNQLFSEFYDLNEYFMCRIKNN